jgi:hypothetical protein
VKSNMHTHPPFNPHAGQNCHGHKMSWLEDPLDASAASLMLKILNNYWPEPN